jgi:hypothetical protein
MGNCDMSRMKLLLLRLDLLVVEAQLLALIPIQRVLTLVTPTRHRHVCVLVNHTDFLLGRPAILRMAFRGH